MDEDCTHEFVKHLPDGSVWCPECGVTIEPDTAATDFPGMFDPET